MFALRLDGEPNLNWLRPVAPTPAQPPPRAAPHSAQPPSAASVTTAGGIGPGCFSDTERVALVLAAAGCPDPAAATVVSIPGIPRSKARPRFGRNGHTFSDPKQVANEKYLAGALRPHFPKPLTGNLAVVCLFFRHNRQTVDADNLLKQILDAGTKARCWEDDKQITAVTGITNLDKENPRTVIAVGSHISSLDRTLRPPPRPCPQCGKTFQPRHLSPCQEGHLQFCTRKCASLKGTGGIDLSVKVPCPVCQKPFKRRSHLTQTCSVSCGRTLGNLGRTRGK